LCFEGERAERRGGEVLREMRGGVCGLTPKREEGDEERREWRSE
jgi:hypothetical protein